MSVYREVLNDLLEQSGVGQQLAVERRMLQQHRQDLSELGQFFLVHISNTHQLQDHSQQARNGAQRWHTSAPYCLPESVTQRFKSIHQTTPIKRPRFGINRRSIPKTDQIYGCGDLTRTFCGWFQQVTPAAEWWAEPAGWGSTETRSAPRALSAGLIGPVIWLQLWEALPPYCPEQPLT